MEKIDCFESPLHHCSTNGNKNHGFPLFQSMEMVTNLLGAIHPSSTMQNEPKNLESAVLIFQFGIFFSTGRYLPSTRDIYLKYHASFNVSQHKISKNVTIFSWRYIVEDLVARYIANICNYGLDSNLELALANMDLNDPVL